MIVRMSKVEIAGPRDLLESVLSLLQELGLLQIEPSTIGFIENKDELYIDFFLPDKRALSERLFLEELMSRTEELFSYIREENIKASMINPQSIIDTISETLRGHISFCKKLNEEKDALKKELSELNRYAVFLDSIESLLKDIRETPDIDFIGFTLRDHDAVTLLKKILVKHTNDKYELQTSAVPDGGIAALVAVEKKYSDIIKDTLSDRDIPELKFPSSFNELSFVEKVRYARDRISGISDEIEMINMQLDAFTIKWGGIYKRVKEWCSERLAVLKTAASAFETRMCFFIYGWMPSAEMQELREKLTGEFQGKVLAEEMEVREEDLDRMPVVLKNTTYFKPFELFTKILPIPRYTSYDPTPFIGVFFPVFFGLILGDAGYGFLLLIITFLLLWRFRKNETLTDAAKVMGVCSVYTILFGLLYGEFFGETGEHLFGLEPFLVDRRTAVIPMLYFGITIGIVHIILGIFLGLITALKRRSGKEAAYRFLHIVFIMFVLLLVASLFGIFPSLLTRPAVLAILFITPFLFFTGGLLAPLELLKSIGNIISYARIMAIGLTSVLLAHVANRLAGMTGDIVLGIVVAGMLHLLNIIIGVFSPTIHSLRLHYVEFFNKFIEPGGRKFEPFKKGY